MELGSSSSEPLSLGKQEQESPSPGKQDRLGDSTSPGCLSAAMSDAEGDAQLELEASDGCPSESLSDGQGGALAVRWRPGFDCGTFVGPDFVTWGIPGQVFAANVYTSLRRVPAAVCRDLLGHLGFPLPTNLFADRCALRLLGIGRSTVRRLWNRLTAAGWQPLVQKQGPESNAASGVSADARRLGLTVRVREAIHVCARGGTAKDYRDAIRRAALAGVPVGTKYNHHSFMDLVEHLAVVCCRDLLGDALRQPLPGLGIPSDLSLVWDGVSIGGTMWSRQETFCVLGVGFCDAAGRIQYRLVATPSENLQKAGPAQVSLVLASLRDHPAGLSSEVLRRRLSVVAARSSRRRSLLRPPRGPCRRGAHRGDADVVAAVPVRVHADAAPPWSAAR